MVKIFQLLKAPFPSPKRSFKKLFWILLLGISCSLFIFLYNPFGIANQAGDWYIDLLLFSLGLVFSLAIIFMEWVIPPLFPGVFKKWNIGKALVWYTLVIVFAGAINFLYKSYLGGFRDFTFMEFLFVLLRTVVISFTVAFFIVGIVQLLNRKKLATIASGENFQLMSGDGKKLWINLNDILYVSSDDNYVDVHYILNGKREKHILRSSLKNIEKQIVNPISSIVKCHRQFLINTNRFEIKKATSRGMTLLGKASADEVPVSSKYVEIIRKKLSVHP